ncbi:MAG: low molecular weight phosphotyrosine protein phosphatase [Clostridia bacterium]|nr:low molecular weight phosphotyrosine protein phosphatase [Clostridia bacterium]MBQ1965169.1 low molecular weight phosphotyrosine protein phosphatase [Clostridia bacterium]
MRIMFVCHGNICRSPMAEFIFRDMLKTAGLDHRISVASSATSTEEIWNGIGNPVYPPAREELAKHGLSCEGKRAVQLQKSDYDKYDLFLVMDENNLRNIFRIFPADPQGKVRKLLDYVGGGDVADPWFTEQFDVTYGDLLRGCKALLEDLIQNGIGNEV